MLFRRIELIIQFSLFWQCLCGSRMGRNVNNKDVNLSYERFGSEFDDFLELRSSSKLMNFEEQKLEFEGSSSNPSINNSKYEQNFTKLDHKMYSRLMRNLIGSSRINCLSTAIAEIMLKVCEKSDHTAYVIYKFEQRKQEFIHELVKNVAKSLEMSVHIEDYENLDHSMVRSCSIFMINSMDEFDKIYEKITPDLFNYNKNFLFIDNNKSLNSSSTLDSQPMTNMQNSITMTQLKQSKINSSPFRLNTTKIFQQLWKKFILYANLVTIDDDSACGMSVTTFEPFTENTCNNTSPVVVNYYKNGNFINAMSHLTQDKLKDLQNCPIRVVITTGSEPFVFILRHPNGYVNYSGRDISLIEELSKSLNFRINYVVLEDKGFLWDNGTAGGMFKFLQNGSADLAINDLWLTKNRVKYFSATKSYLDDDIIFVIPPGSELTSIDKLVYPLSIRVWILMIASFAAGYFIIFLIKLHSKQVQNFFFGRRVRYQYLNMWTGLLGIPQHRLPTRNFSRFILIMFLVFSLIIRNAYQGSIYKIMRSNLKHKEIQTIDQIFEQKDFKFYILALNMEVMSHFEGLKGRFNKQGNLKDKTAISETGFFIIPIYDKGDYTIKVQAPAGYSFEPEVIPFDFEAACSHSVDMNFKFRGFGITGMVNIERNPANIGAKGVTIKLFSDKNAVIATTTTDDSGVFTFSPIVPGSYRVQASHPSWSFSKSEYPVTVTTGNTKLESGSLTVAGFNLEGSIAQPSVKMGFLIYNKLKQQPSLTCGDELNKLPKSEIQQSVSKDYEAQPFCIQYANKNGQFTFEKLSTGSYLIVPYVDSNSIEFNISPSFIEAAITTDNLKLDQSFAITGFTASGRVLLSETKKVGVSGATIKIDGKVVATTGKDGSYTLKNIKDGSYTVQVTATDLEFKDESVRISMTNPKVSDIFVSGFKVCGKVVSDKSFKVAIKKTDSSRTVYATSDPSQGGSFCTFLGNGKYSLEVEIEESERKNGLQFYPIQQSIEVNAAAVSDIIFSQLRAKVTGDVKCLSDDDNSCRDIEITLSSLDEHGHQTSSLKSKLTNGIYTFEEILPGRYQLSVPHDKLCWENHQHKIVVKSTIENVPKFVQSGYKIGPIISSHDVQGIYKFQSQDKTKPSKETKIEFSSGANDICVPKSGTYDLKVSGCHIYEESTKVLSTKSTQPIYINAIKHKNGVRILSEMKEQFTIEVQYEDEKKEVLNLVEQAERVDGYVAYNLNLDLKFGEIVKLTPKSEQMLFKPPSMDLKGAKDCVEVALNFIATKGLVITGRTEPKIAEALVTLSFPKNNEFSPITTLTNAVGEFKFPTIDPTLDYELKAEKESYVFQDYDATRNVFEGHKLCEIIVKVKDEEAKELSNAVISLSGDNYRKNLQTAANGEIKFHSLKPGKYFLRAMMKEYEFKPNSQTIDIKDGETLNIDLSAKRVAYSVFGKITTLSGDPFANVMVEAVSTSEACSNHQEESTTESNGQYRIRGLQTGCDYKIRLQKNNNVDRSLPSERMARVETTDTQNVNFIAINPINICDVIVKIKSKTNDHYKTLKIQMYKKESPDSPVYTQRIENLMMPKSKHNDDIMVFLPRINANDFFKVFFIEFTTTLSEKNYNFKLPSIQFTANTTNLYFEVEFNPILKQAETELNKNSLAALLLIFIVAFVFLKQELVFEVGKNLIAKLNNEASKQPVKKTEGKADKFIDAKEIDELAEFIEEKKKKKSKKNN